MRKITVAAFVSLDGVMQAPGGPEEDPTDGFRFGGWNFPHWDEVMGEYMDDGFSRPYDLLLGRKTYDIFAAHWPYAPADDPVAVAFNACTKYVATRSDRPLTWENTVRLEGDAIAAVRDLKAGDGPDLLTQGSSDFLQSLLATDLVDEFRVMTFPVVLGRGKRLFSDHARPMGLTLSGHNTSTTGVSMATYHPDCDVKVGSFQLSDPSPEELARRAKMAREG